MFFQNVFSSEFVGSLVLGDRQYSPSFRVRSNSGRGDSIITNYNEGPYNLSGNDGDGNSNNILTISFFLDGHWFDLNFNIGNSSSARVDEIVQTLNDNSEFSSKFKAKIRNSNDANFINIFSILDSTRIKFFVKNKGAETVLNFNKFAGIAEIPSYFERHTLDNLTNFPDCANLLIK